MELVKACCPNCASPMTVSQCCCCACDMTLAGDFELPALAKLSAPQTALAMVFLKTHGSIRATGETLGISYPTVKNRLDEICQQLPEVEITAVEEEEDSAKTVSTTPSSHFSSLLDAIDDSTMNVEEAMTAVKRLLERLDSDDTKSSRSSAA